MEPRRPLIATVVRCAHRGAGPYPFYVWLQVGERPPVRAYATEGLGRIVSHHPLPAEASCWLRFEAERVRLRSRCAESLHEGLLGWVLQGRYRGLLDGWQHLVEVYGGDVEYGVHEEADVRLMAKVPQSTWLRARGYLELEEIPWE